jgi:hypothetical protein
MFQLSPDIWTLVVIVELVAILISWGGGYDGFDSLEP